MVGLGLKGVGHVENSSISVVWICEPYLLLFKCCVFSVHVNSCLLV